LISTDLWIGLITFYQRFISPYKGFRCAHHARHNSGTCSNAVKGLIADNGFIKALPLIRARFKECRVAYESIKESRFTSDLPCIDLSCDADVFNCGGNDRRSNCAGDAFSGACDCLGSAGDIINWKKCSRKTKIIIVTFSILLILVLAYLLHKLVLSM